MPVLSSNFLEDENANNLDYELTHGLPRRVVFPDSRPPGTLLLVQTRNPFRLGDFKSTSFQDELGIQKDAYLLWRLSERYNTSSFSVGYLDADRTKRLWQLRALQFEDANLGDEIRSESRAFVQWGRMPLRQHFDRLVDNVNMIRS